MLEKLLISQNDTSGCCTMSHFGGAPCALIIFCIFADARYMIKSTHSAATLPTFNKRRFRYENVLLPGHHKTLTLSKF